MGACRTLELIFREQIFEMLFRRVDAYDYEGLDDYSSDLGGAHRGTGHLCKT